MSSLSECTTVKECFNFIRQQRGKKESLRSSFDLLAREGYMKLASYCLFNDDDCKFASPDSPESTDILAWHCLRTAFVFLCDSQREPADPSNPDINKRWTVKREIFTELSHWAVHLMLYRYLHDHGKVQAVLGDIPQPEGKLEDHFSLLDILKKCSVQVLKILNFVICSRGEAGRRIYQVMKSDYSYYTSSEFTNIVHQDYIELLWKRRFLEQVEEGRQGVGKKGPTISDGTVRLSMYYGNFFQNANQVSKDYEEFSGETLLCEYHRSDINPEWTMSFQYRTGCYKEGKKYYLLVFGPILL